MGTRKAWAAVNLLLAAAYFVTGKLGLTLAFLQPSATAVWPPTGIALAANLVVGYGVWPGILAGAFFVNYTTAGTALTSISIAIGNTIEGALGAYLVNRFAHGLAAFDRPHDAITFALLALVSTAVSATIGVTSLSLAGFVDSSILAPTWLTWWLGDVAGALVVAPLLILWSRAPRLSWDLRQALEIGVWLGLLLLVGQGIFGGWHPFGADHYPLEFLSIPPLIWAAFRLGRRATVTAIVLLSAIAVLGTLRGTGPFVGGSVNESLLLLQAFMATIAVTSMALAAAVGQTSQLLEESRRHLAEVQESRRLLSAREDELRKNIAETLHGRVQNRLLVAGHWLGEALARLEHPRPEIRAYLEAARKEIDRVREEDVRQVSHLLHPAIIAAGLVPAIRSLAGRFEERVRITLEVDPRLAEADDLTCGGLPEPVRLAAYRVVEEALNNVWAHAGASEVQIVLGLAPPGQLQLSIRDNGRGFRRKQMTQGLGLRALGSRVEELEGSWEISSVPGEGTTLSVSLPLKVRPPARV